MQFIFPAFLWALAVLAIPIIIHLFYFRRFRRVYFTNVRFLREVKEETSARSRLRNLLVLIARLLALAFLVLAFAQPFIPQDVEVRAGRKAVSIFIDNSFSMSAMSQEAPLLERAKQRAREIVNAYGVEDRFQILTNDFEGRHQRLVSQEDAQALIDEISASPSVRMLSTVVARQQQALAAGDVEVEVAFIISDFQRNITDLTTWEDTTLNLSLIPLQSVEERNVAIDSAWFEAPVPILNQNNPMLVRVRNFSDEDVENVRLTLRYNEQTKPEGLLSIPANGQVIDTVNLNISQPGWQEATLSVTDFPVQFDDNYFVSFPVQEKVNVLAINDGQPNRFLNSVLQGLRVFNPTFQSIQGLDYGQLRNYQLIVLDSPVNISTGLAAELQQYVREGGNLLVFPARNANLNDYRSFLSGFPANELQTFEEMERSVGDINTDEFVFRDVFENTGANLRLPVTQGNFPLTRFANRREEALLTYRDGSVYLAKYQVDQGNVYLSAAPLDQAYNNLVQNAEVFVPMLYKMSISAGRRRPLAYTIGRDELITADHQAGVGELVYKLRGQGEEFIPEQRVVGSQVFLGIGGRALQAGFYELFLDPAQPLARFAFNYNRRESELSYYRPDDLSELVGDRVGVIDVQNEAAITTRIEERSQGVVLWRWCVILALLFLAVEVLLLRFWKT